MDQSIQPCSETLSFLSDLIAFDTTSRLSNLELIDFVESYLVDMGIPVERSWNKERSKANLFATLGQGEEDTRTGGLVLSGHTDVVPVTGQDWSSDPFKAEIRDGRLYGRGSCDMKGFIAVCLARCAAIVEADLPIPVHLALSYDEEVGCVGVKGLLEQLEERQVRPAACVVGEPTSMRIIRSHKGMFYKRCHITGHAAHSSLVHQGVNAVTAAARTISFIDNVAEEIKREGPFDEAFDPPHSTLHCGVIHGGTANNIIPDACQFDFEIRHLPRHSPLPVFARIEQYTRELEPAMKAVAEQAGFDWRDMAEFPGMDTDSSVPLVSRIAEILGDHEPPGKVSYGTEGGRFQEAGITTLVCGPGSIEQAHKPDEYVELRQLALAERFIDGLVDSIGRSPGLD